MDNLISFNTDSGATVFVQASPLPGQQTGMAPASLNPGPILQNAARSLSEALEPIKSVSQSILNVFSNFDHKPDELEVELSVKLTAEAGIIITSGSVEGNFKISLKWKKQGSAE